MSTSSAPIRLRSQKGLLTRYCNNLNELITRCEGDNALKMLSSSSNSDDFERIASIVYELQATTRLLSDHLATFVSTIDTLFDSLTKEQQDQTLEYIENAHIAIDRADRLAIELEAKRISVRERYPVTEDNYGLAIELLKKKYGNKAELVRVLQKRLDNARPEKPSIQGQRKLLEYMIPLIMQLQKLEVNLDGSYNTQKLLSKFAPRIQRKVLEDFVTQDMSENAWKMQSIVDALDAHIATEERINSMVNDDLNGDTERRQGFKQGSMSKISHHQNCMFCGSPEHRTASCSRYSTIAERRNFLQEHGMCLNCGREGHFASNCTKEGCRNCQGKKHFHALCPQRQTMVTQTKHFAPTTPTPSSSATKMIGPKSQPTSTARNNRNSQTQRSAQAHPIQVRTTNEQEKNTVQTDNDDDFTILHQTTQRENTMVIPDSDFRRKYRRLRQAIPQLPKPTQLYKKIVQSCRHLHDTTASTRTLLSRIENLRNSQEDWKERLAELQIVETLREKTVMEFMLIRTELRTLFSIPPLLMALDGVSESNWRAIISQPQYDHQGNTILTRQSAIEAVIEDQLRVLDEGQAHLNEYRSLLQKEDRKESQQFQSTVLTLLNLVQETIKEGLEKATEDSTKAIWTAVHETASATREILTVTCSGTQTNSAFQDCAGEGIRMSQGTVSEEDSKSQSSEDVPNAHERDETRRIQQNAEFMEGVQEMDEEEDLDSSKSGWSQRKEARWEIRQEIQQIEDEIEKLEAVVYELDMEPTCDPRDFAKGLIRKKEDKKLPCSFCGRVGHHYSDSCASYTNFWDRRYIANAQQLCTICPHENHGLLPLRKVHTSFGAVRIAGEERGDPSPLRGSHESKEDCKEEIGGTEAPTSGSGGEVI
ncbi:zinc knuckle [Ostertagia ostertagi]